LDEAEQAIEGIRRGLVDEAAGRTMSVDEAFAALRSKREIMEAVAGIRRGMASFARGEGRPAREALTAALRAEKHRKRGRGGKHGKRG
jgi:predicted transcriptional regulator